MGAYTYKLLKRGQMFSSKKIRVFATIDDERRRRFNAACAAKGLNAGDVLAAFVDQFLAGEMPPIDEAGTPPPGGDRLGGDGDPLCSMVRACVDAGEPWHTAIRGVVVAIYEKMRRES